MFNWFKCFLILQFLPVFVEIMTKLFFVWSATNSPDFTSLDSVHINLHVPLNRDWLHFLVDCERCEIGFIELL